MDGLSASTRQPSALLAAEAAVAAAATSVVVTAEAAVVCTRGATVNSNGVDTSRGLPDPVTTKDHLKARGMVEIPDTLLKAKASITSNSTLVMIRTSSRATAKAKYWDP